MKEQKKRDPSYCFHALERMDSAIVSEYGMAGLGREHRRDSQGPKERMGKEGQYLGEWTCGF